MKRYNLEMVTQKPIYTTMNKLNVLMSKLPSFLCRVVLFITILLTGVNNVWGQTYNTSGTMSANSQKHDLYIAWDATDADLDLSSKLSDIISELNTYFGGTYTESNVGDNVYLRWSILDQDGSIASCMVPDISNDDSKLALDVPQKRKYVDGIGAYWAKALEINTGNGVFADALKAKVKVNSAYGATAKLSDFSNNTVVCYITNNLSGITMPQESWLSGTLVSEPNFDIEYIFHFTADGLPPDLFPGTYSGQDPTPVPVEVSPFTASSKTFTITPVTTGAKYARLVLEKNGEVLEISRTAITVAGSQSSEERPKRGVYLYNDGGISELNVTVSLNAGTFEDYQLVAYFSDEAPTLEGTTITKEPSTLDEKKIYSFSYPVTTIDKYLQWNQNSASLDIASLIAEDLPQLTSESTKGYIGWSIYDGPYGTGTQQSYHGEHYNDKTNWAMTFNSNTDNTLFSVSDAQVKNNWGMYTNVNVYAPNKDKFEKYKNYVVVAEVSDVSSEKIRVRYIFHFTADGQPPYEFINETDVTADKKVVPYTDYKAANKVFDVSDALVSGAKYARIYLEKYGNANTQSENLTITYDGATITQCATGYEKYGWYLSVAGGIDPSKLSVTGLDADEMMKYNLVIVSSTNELLGAQEPAWEKKTVYSLQREIKNTILTSDATKIENINIQDEILSLFGATVQDFSKSLYAKWYVLAPDGKTLMAVAGGNGQSQTSWNFDILNSGLGDWQNDGNILRFYTGRSGNDASSSSRIEANNGQTDQGSWKLEIAKVNSISVPKPTNDATSLRDYVGYKIVFEFSDDYDTSTNGADPGYRLKYVYRIAEDPFEGDANTNAGGDNKTLIIDNKSESLNIDLNADAFQHANVFGKNIKYVRFFLTDTDGKTINPDGKLEVKYDGSSSNVTSCTEAKSGYYIYAAGEDLDNEKISVSVKIPNHYTEYKLVCLFSTELASIETSGATVTREPDWDLKYIYSFDYNTQTIDKYIAWGTNSTTIDLASYLSTDLPALTSSSTTGYIGWSIYNGPYGSSSKVDVIADHNSTHDEWAITDESKQFPPFHGGVRNEYSISDSQLSGSWNTFTHPIIYAPKTDKFEDHKNFVIVAEVSDVSSEKIRVRYIFHFNADGLPPYELINETNIAADKTVIPITEYEANGQVLDVSDALASGAKYARIYVSKYGNANAESENLTITYDGNPITRCVEDYKKYGWYLSVEDGIDVSQLSITGLTADEMIKYNVVIVSSDEAFSGTQEPAWDKKKVYSFQKEIRNRVMGSDTENHLVINLQEDILNTLSSSVSDFSKHLYAKWYVLNPSGNVQIVVGGNYSGGEPWRFDLRYSGLDAWTNDNNILRYFTDATRTSTVIESENGWTAQIAKADGVYVPNAMKTIAYAGYKIVFEFSDEYDPSTGIEPAYKLKYTTIILDPNAFTGDQSLTGVTDGMTQTVVRNAESVTVDLAGGANTHAKLSGDNLKYARFYLTDTNGNLVSPAGKLEVTYNGSDGNVTACKNTEEGFYVYLGLDGDNQVQTLDKNLINVTLTAPKAYKLYKVVGVFSTAMTEVMPETGETPLTREPDWELQYTYDFVYTDPTTNEFENTTEWRRTGMTAQASTIDPDTDWDTSWAELSAGQYVKWYVVDGSGIQQPLVAGTSRQAGSWAIDVADYTVEENSAVLTGQSTFTSTHWNTWGMPTVYAPAGVEFQDVADYKFICEIYANNTGTGNPNARYTISLYKGFLGELKDGGSRGGEIVDVQNNTTEKSLPLSNATAGVSGAKYARVWLTTADGEMVDPTGKLSVAGMTSYITAGNTDAKYGYYLYNDGENIDLSGLAAALKLDAGSYDAYQVHVALSTNELGTYEPDYDHVYTYSFRYPVKTKYKTLLYDTDSRQCTPHLIGNWQELAVDCGENRISLADKLYVRWYLTAANGETLIPISDFTANQAYTDAGGNNGYYRDDFSADNFNDEGTGTAYNPTITLPEGYNYQDVRVVCVATSKTDGYTHDPWNADPERIQVKYVYTLHTQAELKNQPFVHYEGEGYRYLKEIGEDTRAALYDYIKPDGATGVQGYVWNSSTNSYESTSDKVRQNVHTVDYYYYLDLNENETSSLILPLQYYQGGGNDTEPRAYFRWYDYKTDANSTYLANPGSLLVDEDYGYIALPFSDNPSKDHIGIDFKAPAGFNSLTNEILIACDVSRYLDGMDDSYTYLVHEPTISIRYLFHILPASVIAKEISDKANANSQTKTGLAAVEEKIMNKTPGEKISILEYDGRVVISTNNGTGDFSLRTDLSSLGHYFVSNGGNVTAATQLQWYAYYQDTDNNWWKKEIAMGNRGNDIQAKYSLADFSGEWTLISGTGGTSPTVGIDDIVQMVACVGDGSVMMPIIWTELVFLNAAPQAIGSETEERTVAFMNREYNHAKTLDFNDFFRVGLTTPDNSYDNYTKIPLEIPDAQYGFCYPQLYGLCATNKFASWGEYGIAPLHGDYTLLKSMNMDGISRIWDANHQSINTRWWWGDPLFDVTHERAREKGTSDTDDYGAFLYVDAADEARTIATLEFDAALCHDAKIYYTAYVASMTNNVTKPMVRFRVLTDDDAHPGEKMPVVAFVTGDLESELGTGIDGKWYQVYGHTTIPSELNSLLNGNTRHYYVEIDNYCDNTEGADYCVDQISFYTYTAKVKAEIKKELCSGADEKSEVKLFADAKTLIETIGEEATDGKKIVYYRIYEKFDDVNHVIQDGEELKGEDVYTDADGRGFDLYGAVTVDVNYDWQSVTSTTPVGGIHSNGTPDAYSGYYMGEDGNVYFQFTKRGFVLEPGKKYFVSVYDFVYDGVSTPSGWGHPYNGNACSVFSNDIVAGKMYLNLMDSETGEVSNGVVDFGCGKQEVTKSYDMKLQYPMEDGSYRTYSDIKFDFFITESTENSTVIFNGITGLREALDHLRDIDKNTFTSSDELPQPYGAFTEEDRTLIATYMNNTEADGKLLLSASTRFNYKFTKAGERHFAALPVDKETSDGEEICSLIDMKFFVDPSLGGPQMTLGFDDVNYPASYTRQVVRVGLEQLRMMKKGYQLHIPVKSYKDNSQGMNRKLYFPIDGANLTISAVDKSVAQNEQLPNTTDPVLLALANAAVGQKFADIVAPNGSSRPYVDRTHMYLPLDLSGCEIDFHEGYEYEVSTSFLDEAEAELDNKCIVDLFLVIKVVPEFVTWESQEIGVLHDVDYFNASWYLDANWNRSERTELYKGEKGTATNTPTAGHPDGYQNNSEINKALTTHPGYVPMKFTYVTLPTDNHAPSLIYEPKVTTDGTGSARQGGALIDPSLGTGTQMYTDPSPYSLEVSSRPTENIRYDMLVRYGAHENGGVGCFGHRCVDADGNWIDDGSTSEDAEAKVFDVEKFYGNICKEIYFKPGAEILKQQRLTYEKAWVEKLLEPNKWYLMSTPLKGTYAGDMYVPFSNGRQETEAFQNISFVANTTNNSLGAYSRTKYPIYQRSWGIGHDSKVYTRTDDMRRTDYSANLKWGSVSTIKAEWSHTFNDVQTPYNNYSGFSIRAHKKEKEESTNHADDALIRLPKADTSYDYYQWDGEIPSSGAITAQKVAKGNDVVGQLVYDRNTTGLGDEGKQMTIATNSVQAQGTDTDNNTYYLVGNPYMSAIDMGKFFSFNPGFEKVYYTYDGSELTAVDATSAPLATSKNIIKPTQAFFLKCNSSSAPENIVFHTDMMTDGNVEIGTAAVGGARAMSRLTLNASNSSGASSASVNLSEEASADYVAEEDVTTLFDSNLSDVPMVFTVAGGQAVSIDKRPQIDLVPFGVACASSNEPVEVNVNSSLFTLHSSLLYIIDAVTGSVTEVGEGSTYQVQPNDYGRYFLTTRSDMTAIREATAEGGIVVSVRQRQLTVRASSELETVRVLNTNGMAVASLNDCGKETTVNLALGGVYLVDVKTADGQKTMKVIVK